MGQPIPTLEEATIRHLTYIRPVASVIHRDGHLARHDVQRQRAGLKLAQAEKARRPAGACARDRCCNRWRVNSRPLASTSAPVSFSDSSFVLSCFMAPSEVDGCPSSERNRYALIIDMVSTRTPRAAFRWSETLDRFAAWSHKRSPSFANRLREHAKSSSRRSSALRIARCFPARREKVSPDGAGFLHHMGVARVRAFAFAADSSAGWLSGPDQQWPALHRSRQCTGPCSRLCHSSRLYTPEHNSPRKQWANGT